MSASRRNVWSPYPSAPPPPPPPPPPPSTFYVSPNHVVAPPPRVGPHYHHDYHSGYYGGGSVTSYPVPSMTGSGATPRPPPPPPPPPPPSSSSSFAPVRKRPRRDDGSFVCVVCRDASLSAAAAAALCAFPTAAALASHVASHVVCRHPGCTYAAAPKLVNAHFHRAHGRYSGSGLKSVSVRVPGCRPRSFRVCVGDHPDDVVAWIAERRKHFPTRANVEKKRRAERERRERGDDDRDAGRRRSRETNEWLERGRVEDEETADTEEQVNDDAATKTNDDDDDDDDNNPLSNLLGGYGSSSDDDDDETNDTKKSKEPSPATTNVSVRTPESAADDASAPSAPRPTREDVDKARQSAVEHGRSVVGENERTRGQRSVDAPVTATTDSNNNQNPNHDHKARVCRYFERTGKCRHGDACAFRHDEDARARWLAAKQQRRDPPPRSKSSKRPRPATSLLEKLLEREERRETCLALQCLRYMVQNDFFRNVTTTVTSGGGDKIARDGRRA